MVEIIRIFWKIFVRCYLMLMKNDRYTFNGAHLATNFHSVLFLKKLLIYVFPLFFSLYCCTIYQFISLCYQCSPEPYRRKLSCPMMIRFISFFPYFMHIFCAYSFYSMINCLSIIIKLFKFPFPIIRLKLNAIIGIFIY